ncbi:MAG: hypothetical protein H7202_03395 [Pedobacter sp.]|nr:hypothetical protein [Pedobacter sp.]
MKFLKPILIILAVIALTYSVSAREVSFNRLTDKLTPPSKTLPINGDLLFAFTAIFSLGGYMAFKK